MAHHLYNRFMVVLQIVGFFTAFAGSEASGWFPIQKAPKWVIPVKLNQADTPAQTEILHILAQSVSGLAAKAVNEGRGDAMIWVEVDKPDYLQWRAAVAKRLGATISEPKTIWQVIEDFRDLCDGYILYTYDQSKGKPYEVRQDVDHSVNVATSLAGVMNAILIDVSLEEKTQSLGLKCLFDARNKEIDWPFQHYQHKLNQTLLFTLDPKTANNRELAIAHRGVVVFGVSDTLHRFLEWVVPPAPILGWNCGDESQHTLPVTEYGHFQTASNWAYNLPLLSADALNASIQKIKTLDPRRIDFDDSRMPAAFMISDGDNVQWLLGGFFFNEEYWANPAHGQFPIAWTACSAQLAQLAPDVVNYLSRMQPNQTSIIEFGGGYYYPDRFANRRADRLAVLRQHAERISAQVQRTGTKVFGFICKDVNSPEAMEAYRIYAQHIKGLIGMVALQYYPYDGGQGKVFWVANADGVEIPVLTATHTLWNNADWPTGGAPAKIARLLNQQAAGAADSDPLSYGLVVVHAWSYFRHVPDKNADDEAENVPRGVSRAVQPDVHRGLAPVQWTIQRLEPTLNVVSIEELIWRVRMRHDPSTTKDIIYSKNNKR